MSGTIAPMSPPMIGEQPPSSEMRPFSELLDHLPHFCNKGGYVRQQQPPVIQNPHGTCETHTGVSQWFSVHKWGYKKCLTSFPVIKVNYHAFPSSTSCLHCIQSHFPAISAHHVLPLASAFSTVLQRLHCETVLRVLAG